MNESTLIIVTGAAGFIGMHVCRNFLKKGIHVIGIDNLNSYYDVELKKKRIEQLLSYPNFSIHYFDICNQKKLNKFILKTNPEYFIHLAAQAGVRYSLTAPYEYVQSNLVGFLNVLEACRHAKKIKHLIYASSSSVYGNTEKIPFSETDPVEKPLNLYAATKRSNELMAYSYSHLYGIPCTGLRFFTVYGPWGRPDMSPILFACAIFENKPIQIFNHGKMKRDFTYIDDIVFAIEKILFKTEILDFKDVTDVPHKIFNIGNSQPVELMKFIKLLENIIGKKAIKKLLPLQKEDVLATSANTEALCEYIGMQLPNTPLQKGLSHFVEWVKNYYQY